MVYPYNVYKYAIKEKGNLSRSDLDSQDLSEYSLCFEIKLMPMVKLRNNIKEQSFVEIGKVEHGRENIGSFLAGGDL